MNKSMARSLVNGHYYKTKTGMYFKVIKKHTNTDYTYDCGILLAGNKVQTRVINAMALSTTTEIDKEEFELRKVLRAI